MKKRIAMLIAAFTVLMGVLAPATVLADTSAATAASADSATSGTSSSSENLVSDKTYVSLGADLTADEKATVLNLLGINEASLNDDITVTVTNADEHQYLDSYLSASVIGSRALSSCRINKLSSGAGIQVETHNITYVTPAMYENALATAGLKNASIVVAGPFSISGTAALVGAMKAYEKMTGDVIKPEEVDASVDELITTSQLAEDVGDSDKAAQLIAAVKQVIVENKFSTDEEIGKAVDDISGQMQITLSDKDRQLIIDLMKKIASLNIDVNTLTEQAKNIYNEIKNGSLDLSKYGITQEQAQGFFQVLQELMNNIVTWFKGLFGG